MTLYDGGARDSSADVAGLFDQAPGPEDDWDVEPLAERAASAARNALSTVQDGVAEATTEPWPGAAGTLPLPGARADERQIFLWYGPDYREDGAVLTLAPIPLAELEHAT